MSDGRWSFGASVRHHRGDQSKVQMHVNRRLKSGRLDVVDLTLEEAYALAETLLKLANVVRRKGETL